MKSTTAILLLAAAGILGCMLTPSQGGYAFDDEAGATGETGDDTSSSTSSGAPPPGGGDDDGDDGDDDDDGIRFDVPVPDALPAPSPDGPQHEGCGKIDFLFVIDNSGSMEDEQQNLVNSFPGFMAAIQNTVKVEDFHIMAIDSDEGGVGACNLACAPDPPCCAQNCAANPQCTCNGVPCTPGSACDTTLGSGKTVDQSGEDCGILGDNRYMVLGQPELTETFSCVALVGSGGDGNERPMQAMVEAVTTQSEPTACNEGFVRDDAVLVATYITDEADVGKSAGGPTSWRQTLVDVKYGDETALVVLGLVGDTDLPGAICTPYTDGGDGAEPAPELRDFAESFPHGMWCPVCAPDYASCFDEAVSVIDTACDEYVPPG